jgi:type IV secretory pathway VirB10-like protein
MLGGAMPDQQWGVFVMDLFKALAVSFVAASLAAPAQAAPGLADPAMFDRFLATKSPTPWKGVTKMSERKTNYFLPTGFVVPARLSHKVVSYNVDSPCIAVVDRDIVYLDSVVIPSGTQFIGTAAVEKSHDRILVSFNDIVFPTGDEVHFSGMALSLDGSVGIVGEVQTFKDASVANTVLRSVVAGTQNALMLSGASPMAAGMTQGLAGEATHELDTQRQQVTVSITVPEDTGIRIYFNQRLEY